MANDIFTITTDQQIMDQAVNYNAMLYRLIEPYLQGDVLEIGSGIGNFTKKIIALETVRSVTCYEIDKDCCAEFKQNVLAREHGSKITLHETDFNKSTLDRKFDFIFSFNVLEHIEDDRRAVHLIDGYLKPNAYLVLYLPAMNCLYGSIDKELEHYRRYNKKMIRSLFRDTQAQMQIVQIKYLNTIGALGWFYTNRIAKHTSQSSAMVSFYDSYIFPPMNAIEQHLPTFFGANILIIAKSTKK